jgi:hypothetical protein
LQNWPHRWQEQMSTGMLSHVTGQLVCKNEYNIVYPQDIFKVKTGIRDIVVFHSSPFAIREMIMQWEV